MRIEWDAERDQWDASLKDVREKVAELETDKSNAIIKEKMDKMKQMLKDLESS